MARRRCPPGCIGATESGRVKVLALISDCPWPPNTGSRVRNAYLWPALERLGVEVRLLALDQGHTSIVRNHTGDARSGVDIELHALDREAWPSRAWHGLTRSYHQWPVSGSLRDRVDDYVNAWHPDVIHAEELRMAAYLPDRRHRRRALRTVTLHNVESDLLRQTGSTALRRGRALVELLHRASLARFERRAIAAADLAFAYSAADLVRYRELVPGARWAATRNGTHAAAITPVPPPATPALLLLGSLGYAPNVQGLFWFLDRVLPLLPRELPVTVAGSRAPGEVRRRLARAPVRFEDSPEDVAPLYATHALCVVPLFQGSGTRGKILEALAYERPVVTTTPGVSGLELSEGEGFVVADDPERFAARVARLAAAPAERAALARRGRDAVLARYDWSVVARDLVAAWSSAEPRP
jgi:glycosyltransferase involved in cell wall biosynthesis